MRIFDLRITNKSQEIRSNPLLSQNQSHVEDIVRKIDKGHDIPAHLSRRVLAGYAPKQKSKHKELTSRVALDLLLNDWGIHHLHLSNVVEADGFVSGGDIVLFAIFSPSRAYVLDLAPHRTWTNQHFVEIAVRNWPNDGLFLELEGIMPLAAPISTEDRRKFRNLGVTTHGLRLRP